MHRRNRTGHAAVGSLRVHVWIAGAALAGMVVGVVGYPVLLAIFGPLQFAGVVGFLVTVVRYRVRSGIHP